MTSRYKLRELTVKRIALARQGINQHAHILVTKAKDEEEAKESIEKSVTDILSSVATGLIDAEVLKDSMTTDDFRDILPPETLTSLETVIKSALSATSTGEQMSIQEHMDNLPEEVVDYVADLETQVATLTKSLEEAAAKPAEEEKDPVAKTLADLPEEAQEIFKANAARLEKAEKELETLRVAKATETWVAKARAFDGAIEDPEALGATLREIADLKPELADAVESALKTAADRVSKGNLFKEVGHAGDASEPATRISAIAKSLRDADPKLSQAAAESLAWKNNPDLYDQHVAEVRSR